MPETSGERREGVAVPRSLAERVRLALKERGLLETELQPIHAGEKIIFPLKPKALNNLSEISLMEVLERVEAVFIPRQRRPRSIKETLSPVLPATVVERLPSSYDIVGDVALVHIPRGLEGFAEKIGEAILEVNPSVKVVLGEAGPVVGVHRTRKLIHLAGERRTETIHRENGCIFRVDLEKTYFSPRLSGERLRIASLTRKDETVADMFSGVGPFAITIAKHSRAKVYAAEINEEAYKLLVENIRINKVEDKVTPLLGDCREVLIQNRVEADRLVMNYPSAPFEFLDSALKILRERGSIHLYGFSESVETFKMQILERLSKLGASCEAVVRELRPISPRRLLMVADLTLAKG